MRTLLAICATLAAGLALAACGGSEPEVNAAQGTSQAPAGTTEATTTAPATTRTETLTVDTETESDEAGTETEPPAASQPLVVRVEGGEPVGGVQKLEVKSGEQARFVVEADAPEEVHVHGYDILKEVGPGKDARFSFTADLEGIFEVELEESGVQIVSLVVEP
jgi:hypothetical protein